MKGLWQLLFLGVVTPVLGAPVPPPPADFGGAQYIDRQGCVFTRSPQGWTARPDPAGGQLCGFPPSLDGRRRDPDSVDVLTRPDFAPPPDPAALLAERLAVELRPADIAGATLPAADLPSERPDPMLSELSAAVAASAGVSSSLAALAGAPADVCRRLGYQREPVPDGARDPAGVCPGMRPPTPEPRLAAGAARVTPPAGPAPAAAAAVVRTSTAAQRPEGRQPSRPAARAAPATGAAKVPAPPAAEMIPPHARYVQLGTFNEEIAAIAALRDLAGRGLPAARSRGGGRVTVLAGPFADRQALITALDRLRGDGWPGASAR